VLAIVRALAAESGTDALTLGRLGQVRLAWTGGYIMI